MAVNKGFGQFAIGPTRVVGPYITDFIGPRTLLNNKFQRRIS